MNNRFYAPGASKINLRVRLPAREATHLTKVLRLEIGSIIQVFDGQGHEFRGTLARTDQDGTFIDTFEPIEPAPESPVSIILAQALLKGRKFDQVIRDATMLGVTAIQPLVTSFTDVSKTIIKRSSSQERWRRIAISSAKQSGRAVVPTIESPVSIEQHLTQHPSGRRIMLVEPNIQASYKRLDSLSTDVVPSQAIVTIGPEGGWSNNELATAQEEAWELLTLGSRTLRADAAPVAAIAVFLFLWGDL